MKFLIFLSLYFVTTSQENPTVQTILGKIEGHTIKSHGGRLINAYEGVPYAKPPIGNLRFRDPQPIDPWIGTWKATSPISLCYHSDHQDGTILGSENCLYLNVYTPSWANLSSNLDVIVHIHGGAYVFGHPQLAGPRFLLDRDVIYVNFNYRLGAFGFLSTKSSVVSGNQGLKDQQMVLVWIRTNIDKFGGNPDSVTLTGLSAGAVLAHLHYFSKTSRGLFQRGVSHSGTALVSWAFQKRALETTRRLASLVGCNIDNVETMVDCLRERPAFQIVQKTKLLYSSTHGFTMILFGPVVEESSKNSFLDEHPYCSLKSGNFYDVPWLTSVTSDEGVFSVMMLGAKFDEIQRMWNTSAPHLLFFDDTCPDDQQILSAHQIKQFYLQERNFSKETASEVIKIFSDRYFVDGLDRASKMQAKMSTSSVYVYKYGYKSGVAKKYDALINYNSDLGVNHDEDCKLLYDVKYIALPAVTDLTEEDELVKNVMVNMLVSFAKNGNPKVNGTPWKPVGKLGELNLLEINGPGNINFVSEYELAPVSFWDSLPFFENEKMLREC